MTKTYTNAPHIQAVCEDCGKVWRSRNAMGVAKRHSTAHGHTVTVEQLVVVTYTPEGSEYDREVQSRKGADRGARKDMHDG